MVKKDKEKNSEHDPFLERESQKYENPIPSREFILAQLIKWNEPIKRRILVEHFSLEDPFLQEALRRRLKAMVRDGQLLKTTKGYLPITEMEICQGQVVIEREGDGYLRTENGQIIPLNAATLKGYYHGDEVEAQVIRFEEQKHLRGRIIKLIKGVIPLVVGRLLKSEHGFELVPFDRKFSRNITIPKVHKGGAKAGDIVQAQILREEKFQYHVEPVAKVLEVLGDFSTPGIEINIALRKFNVPHIWPKAALQECEKWSDTVSFVTEQREDITKLNLVTIDGEDAKDYDDAVYCETKLLGGWRLWVAIADVSHYVKPGSALDKEAQLRGNSTYFPGSAVPMLPERLSNGLCSLKPQVLRYALVCQMNISRKGVITRSRFFRAVINSKARLTYTEVAEMIHGNTILKAQYAPLVPSLEALHKLYHALHKERKNRGAIDFETVETRILFDSMGKIKNIVPQIRNVAHKMIEESMLAANVCAAKFIQRHKQDTLFRIHDKPPKDKLAALRQFLAELGLSLPGKDSPSPKDFAQLVEKVSHREDSHMIETVMLRSLSQAQYSPKNVGHFGLAYPAYLHFTSPIRRYPDLIVHRIIADILYEQKTKKRYTLPLLEKLGIHCSETERRSDDATRDAALALKCHFMQNKVGEHFHGIVAGVANFGLFIELQDIYIEGMLHVTSLGDEYFHYDPTHHRLIGERTRKTYRLGDSIEVKVVKVDVEAKKIDLELLKLPNKSQPRKKNHSRKKKTSRKFKKDNF